MLSLTLTLPLSSCNSYLDTENTKETPYTQTLTSLEALQGTTANLYTEPWYFFQKQRYVMMGDARANNLFSTQTAVNDANAEICFNDSRITSSISNAWGSLYNVVTQSEYVINDYVPYCINNGICSDADAKVCEGEAQFMVGMAYYFLATYWHDVPIVTDPTRTTTEMYCNNYEDVMQYAINATEKASAMLPATPYQTGRVSKASADALLSRLYITMAAYAKGNHFAADFKTRALDKFYGDDSDYKAAASLDKFFYVKAEKAARAALANTSYGLMDDYEDIFKVQNNNCKEVLFALQFPAGISTSGLGNEMASLVCPSQCINDGLGRDGMSYSTFASFDFVADAVERGGFSRNRGNLMLPGTTYEYLYHEYNNTDGYDGCKHHVYHGPWMVDPTGDNTLRIKKQLVGGTYATNGVACKNNSGFDTPMLRYSEVLLNLAEALMGQKDIASKASTSDAEILGYVNQVRRRAYKLEINNPTEYDAYPGDYTSLSWDDLLIERRMEFFFEGIYWGDIVRRSFMSDDDLQRMVDYNNNKVYENEGSLLMGAHRECKYKYTMANTTKDSEGNYDYNQKKMGKVERRTNADGSLMIIVAPRECIHKIPAGSYCHSSAVGEGDNLWSMIYPPTEVSQNSNLQEAPVPFQF